MAVQRNEVFNKITDEIKRRFNIFGDTSNLHGIRNVFSVSRIPYFKRLFWSCVLLTSCLSAGFILQSALKLFSTTVGSYSVETNYLYWNTPFPAVTICEYTDSGQVKTYLKQHNKSLWLNLFYKDVTFWNERYCSVCGACVINETCEENFEGAVKEIRKKCSRILTDCWWGDKQFRCCSRFHRIATEFGECHVFNSALLSNANILTVNRRIGLPDLVVTATQPVQIYVHAPEDMVSIALENGLQRRNVLPLITELEAILTVEQTINDPSVMSLPVSMRGCLFEQDHPSHSNWPFKKYSYSSCILYCRVLSQSSICNCTHHFLSTIVGTPACDIKGLICLFLNKDEITKFHCNCPIGCDETRYKTTHIFKNRLKTSPELLKRGSVVRIRLAQLPTLRVRRLAIKDTLGFVVDVGGVGGVFFGASLLSIIEMVYLFCIRRN